jgi:hypothetical protein
MKSKLITLAQTVVTTSGTEVQVSSTPLYASTVIFSCPAANTGAIYIGDVNVSTTRGIEVAKGVNLAITADMLGRPGGTEFDLSDLYVDAATNGDKVNISYVKLVN